MTVRFVVLGCGRIGKMHAEYLHRRVAGAEVVFGRSGPDQL